jgi:hypothetical protein
MKPNNSLLGQCEGSLIVTEAAEFCCTNHAGTLHPGKQKLDTPAATDEICTMKNILNYTSIKTRAEIIRLD